MADTRVPSGSHTSHHVPGPEPGRGVGRTWRTEEAPAPPRRDGGGDVVGMTLGSLVWAPILGVMGMTASGLVSGIPSSTCS
jgi:hypothetical protein